MRLDRRTFISGTTMLVSNALLVRAASSTPSAAELEVKQGSSSMPFVDTRGGRSAKPAVQTEALAAHCIQTKFSDLDQTTLLKAKLRILDLMGGVIGGAPAVGNTGLVDVVRRMGGAPEASIIGYPVKTSAAQAAMVNAVIARSYDFDVMTVKIGDRLIGSHISPTTGMTALALCEHGRLSGKDFVTALVVGDDIGARTLAAAGMNFSLGWDGASTFSALAAAAIASRLLGLSVRQAQDAFGLTVNTIAGTNQNTWDSATDWKLPQGLVARNGIFAAELARHGWVGMGDALRAPFGFYAQYTNGCEHPEVLTTDLGKVFYAEEYFKPYPACAHTHVCLECALTLRANNRLSPADIDRVIVRMPAPSLASTLAKPFDAAARDLHNEANFSIQFQVANALLRGAILQDHYAEAAIREPAMIAMVNKVSLAVLPESGDVEIEVVTRNGRRLVGRHASTPSRYPHPTIHTSTHGEIVAKFRQQVAFSGFVSTATADEIIRRVDAIEHEENMADFVKLLTRSYFT